MEFNKKKQQGLLKQAIIEMNYTISKSRPGRALGKLMNYHQGEAYQMMGDCQNAETAFQRARK